MGSGSRLDEQTRDFVITQDGSPVYSEKQVSRSVHETWTGVNTPGFSALRRKGMLIPYQAYQKEVRQFQQNGTYNITNGSTVWAGSGVHPAAPLLDMSHLDVPVDDDGLILEAIGKLESGDYDVLTFVAELSSTHQLLYGAVRRIIAHVDKVAAMLIRERGISRSAARLLATSESVWLEARYGWRPLYYDLRGLSQTVCRTLSKGNRRLLRGVSTVSASDQRTTEFRLSFNSQWGGLVRTTVITQVNVKGMAAAVTEAHRFLAQPLRTAWELTRFSFVLDWFINLGDMIRGISSLASGISPTTAIGSKVESQITQSFQSDWISPTYSGGFVGWVKTARVTTLMRSPAGSSVGLRTFANLDLPKFVDLAFLVRQFFSRR